MGCFWCCELYLWSVLGIFMHEYLKVLINLMNYFNVCAKGNHSGYWVAYKIKGNRIQDEMIIKLVIKL